jgi:ketosteroid isomerase-like protein
MSPTRMSRLESAMHVVLDFNEAFNRHDVTGLMQLLSENCVFEYSGPPPDGTTAAGKEEIFRFWQDFFRETLEAHQEIEEIFSLGLRCILRWKCTWVDTAGRNVHARGVDIFTVNSGFICEKLSYIKG